MFGCALSCWPWAAVAAQTHLHLSLASLSAINGPSRVDTSKPVAAPDLSDSVINPVVEQLFQKARQAARDGHSASAIEAVSQAIGIDPGDSRLFRLRGDIYTLVGEYANARADLALAIRNEPQNAELRNIRGYFLMSRGLQKEAVADFDKALQLNPQFSRSVEQSRTGPSCQSGL